MKLSIVLPIYNEAESLDELFTELERALKKGNLNYEIIAVNDGSKDNSFEVLHRHAKRDKRIKVLHFITNFGQTAALSAGIDQASGDVIVPMDSDLENDPDDIKRLVAKLEEGYDVVSGWRRDRWEGRFLTRKLPSMTANALISLITQISLHDYGCTLKAYRAEMLKGVKLYGEMHRFVPAYAAWRGGKVTEMVVSHRPRKHGTSNYGISRTFRVLLDLVLLRFLHQFMNRPIHFFGMVGFVSLALGVLAGIVAVALRFAIGLSLISTPLPTLAALLIIVGVQFIGMGILAEVLMRVYYESQDKTPYTVRETLNLEEK